MGWPVFPDPERSEGRQPIAEHITDAPHDLQGRGRWPATIQGEPHWGAATVGGLATASGT